MYTINVYIQPAPSLVLHVGGALLPGHGRPLLHPPLPLALLGGRQDEADARQRHGGAQVLPRLQECQHKTDYDKPV